MDTREKYILMEVLEILKEEIIKQQKHFTSPALVGVERAIKYTIEAIDRE